MEGFVLLLVPLIAIPLVAVVVIAAVWQYRRATSLLENWAARNGYRLLSRELRRVRRGPFFFTTAEEQEVYRVTVQDRWGQIHHGYVRCGGYFLGMLSDNVEVRWDPPSQVPAHRPGFPVLPPARPAERGGREHS